MMKDSLHNTSAPSQKRFRVPARFIALAIVAAAVSYPTSAGAVLVPNVGAHGVHIGWTKGQVRALLGIPGRQVIKPDEIMGSSINLTYGGLTVVLTPQGYVIAMEIKTKRERTRNRIGVGSTINQVARRVRGVRCSRNWRNGCSIGGGTIGRRYTSFHFNSRRKVTSISIGRVID